MTGKKIKISPKPNNRNSEQGVEEWVNNRNLNDVQDKEKVKTEKMKRLTIDISESLHIAVKSACAMRGTKIADEVRELLIAKYLD